MIRIISAKSAKTIKILDFADACMQKKKLGRFSDRRTRCKSRYSMRHLNGCGGRITHYRTLLCRLLSGVKSQSSNACSRLQRRTRKLMLMLTLGATLRSLSSGQSSHARHRPHTDRIAYFLIEATALARLSWLTYTRPFGAMKVLMMITNGAH